MGIYSSVACREEAFTVRETADFAAGINCSVLLRCDWGLRFDLMNDILTYPRPWPKTPGLTPFAVSASSVPDKQIAGAGVGQECTYADALVTVNYSTQVTDIASESLEPATEQIALDHNRFRWVTGLGATAKMMVNGEAPVRILRTLNIVRTRYKLAAIPAEYLTCLAGVNNAAYTSGILGLTFPAETLMFQPGGTSRTFTNLGASGWTATAKFCFNPNGWNTYWRAETQSFEYAYVAGSTTRYIQHALVDYSGLFA